MMNFKIMLALVGLLVSVNKSGNAAFAGTVLHQIQTTTTTSLNGAKPPREQYSIAYLDGTKFRHEIFADKTGKGEWRSMTFFDGKQGYACKREKNKSSGSCETTGPGGPLDMLENLVKSTGGNLQVKIKSFTFAPAATPTQTIAGMKCEAKKMMMNIEMGLMLGANFVPAATGSMTGEHCLAPLAGWNPSSMIEQLKAFGHYFAVKTDFDKFLAAVKEGVGFDLATDTTMSLDLGGKSGKSPLRADFKRTTVKLEKASVSASQFQLPKDFTLTAKSPG